MAGIRWLVMAALLLAATTVMAVPAGSVPAFKVRVRVTMIGEAAPAAEQTLNWNLNSGGAGQTVGGEWSDWIESTPDGIAAIVKAYPNSYNKHWQVRSLLVAAGKRPPGNLAIEVETTLVEGGTVHQTPGLLWGTQLGILLWKDGAGAIQIDTLAGHGRRVYDAAMQAAVLPPADRPTRIAFGGRYIGGDHDLLAWSEGVRRLTGLGFNAMHPLPGPVVPVVRAEGIAKVWGAVYNPPGYAFNFAADREAVFADFVKKQLATAAAAGWQPEDVAFWVTSDEPGWYYPAQYEAMMKSPEAMAAFHKYLQERGLTPADFGKTEWSEVTLIGRKQHTDLPSRRLFYWSNRWVPYASSTFFAEVTRAFEAQLAPGVPVLVNFNNFMGRLYQPGPVGNNNAKTDPNAAMGQHDWLEFGRVRGSTCIATEDWFGDDQAGQWSFYAARMRSAAAYRGVGFGALVIPRTSGARPDGMPQKLLALVGNGAKTIKFFTFGPEYNFPGNCYSERSGVFKPLADGMGLVGRAEDLLYPGVMAREQVAILTPQSSQVWDLGDQEVARGLMDVTNTSMVRKHMAYMTETFGLYSALQHRAVPVGFVDEEDLAEGTLAGRKLLLVTAPDLPAESVAGLLQWVEAGGTLVLTAGAARWDRYGMKLDAVDALLDITGNSLPQGLYGGGWGPANAGTVRFGDEPADAARPVAGLREGLTLADDRHVIARFDDGKPAVLARALGQGRILRFAFYPGSAYLRTGTSPGGGRLPVGFDGSWRDYLHGVAQGAGVAPPVTVDRPLVEAPLLASDLGYAVTLLNWSGEPQPATVVTIRSDRPFARVVSANGAALQTATATADGQTLTTVTLDLPGVDVLKLYYERE